jgi:hypothetical protein
MSRKQTTFNLQLLVIYLFVVLMRGRDSLLRLPSDPGYSYISDAARNGLFSLNEGDPYFHIAARSLAWVTSWFPLSWQAVVLASLVHLVWGGCAMTISRVVKLESKSTTMALLAGALLVAAPHASESSIGNVGNVKWPLLASVLVICSSGLAVRHFRVASLGLMLIAGLTNPLTVLCLVPLTALSCRVRSKASHALLLGGICLSIFLIQVIKVGGSAVLSGQSTRVARPWEGMGIFWWSGWVGPIVISLAIITTLSSISRPLNLLNRFEFLLAAAAFVTAVASYLMGGIGDRYFVLPTTISLIALILTIRGLVISERVKRIVLVFTLIGIFVPTVKWFDTGWYMTGGPTWNSEVKRANESCITQSSSVVELFLSPNGSVELDCQYVLRG